MKFKIVRLLVFVLFLILSIIFPINFLSAEENLTVQQQAGACLNSSNLIIKDLIDNNFSYQRVNDSLMKAQSIYDAQILLLDKGKQVDFSLILSYCEDIVKIRNLAFEAKDQYSSLRKFYDISITSEMNSSSINIIFLEIENEIASERYERVPPLVDSAYEEISKVKSSYTTLNLFYESTTRSLKKFLEKNGLTILIVVFVLLLLFLIFNKQISRKIIKNKISSLELRRQTLQDLIKRTQTDYFQNGDISEGNFNMRTKKFAEFIRDIDRQIPMLKEELAKIKGLTKNEKS